VRRALDRVAVTAANDLNVDREEQHNSSPISGLDPSTPVTPGAEYRRGYTTIHEREELLHGAAQKRSSGSWNTRWRRGISRCLRS
jgi:hypothetical protein